MSEAVPGKFTGRRPLLPQARDPEEGALLEGKTYRLSKRSSVKMLMCKGCVWSEGERDWGRGRDIHSTLLSVQDSQVRRAMGPEEDGDWVVQMVKAYSVSLKGDRFPKMTPG